MRWKYLSVLMAISVIWPACCFPQNQPARPAAPDAPTPQSQTSPAYATSIRAFGNVPPAKSAARGATPNGAGAPIDPQLKADLLHLFALTNVMRTVQSSVRAVFLVLRPAILRTLPETPHRDQIANEITQKMEGLITSQEFQNRLLSVYAKYFNDEQARALIQFYESPIGQHEIAIEGPLREDLQRAGQEFALERAPAIYAGLCAEYPELQGKAKFCPAAPPPPSAPQKQ